MTAPDRSSSDLADFADTTVGIPLVDIADLASPDEAARRAVAARIGAACREVGFFAIAGHGVPAALVEAAFAQGAQLFALPPEAKRAMAIDRLGGNRGYVGLGVEALDETAAADHKEAFNLIWSDDGRTRPPNVWPPLPDFRATLQAYFDAVLDVGTRLHRAFALDLELPEDFFAGRIDRPLATLRLLRYPAPSPSPVAAEADRPGAGAHTDYGNVTLLATDGVAGLQVRRRDGGWIDVPALPGAFVCNIGDCLMRWTNDVYVSTPHRVRRPVAERHSIAFFLDPNPEALVAAIPSCVPPGEAPRHAPITTHDHLQQRFAATYGR
jgi:isopenicillin N synthase-like dioxygenase